MLSRTITRSKFSMSRTTLPFRMKNVTTRRLPSISPHKLNNMKPSNVSFLTKAVSTSTLMTYTTMQTIPYEWLYGVLGGAFIGGSSAMYLAFHGRIAGISGIFGRILDHTLSLGRNTNKLASCTQFGFATGLLSSGIYWSLYMNRNHDGIDLYGYLPHKTKPFEQINYAPSIMLLSGLMVGIGTRLGMGCTSGHGVCGLARQSLRSLTAVCTFMSMGALSATLLSKYYPDLYTVSNSNNQTSFKLNEISQQLTKYGVPCMTMLLLLGAIYSGFRGIHNEYLLSSLLPSISCGLIFGTGLIYSGMTKPEKVRGFLNLDNHNFAKHFDPTLLFVFVGALSMSVPLFPLITRSLKYPLFSSVWHLPTNKLIDKRLIIGASIFGTGWGMAGVCPGPGIVSLSSQEYSYPFWIWFISMMIGMRVGLLL